MGWEVSRNPNLKGGVTRYRTDGIGNEILWVFVVLLLGYWNFRLLCLIWQFTCSHLVVILDRHSSFLTDTAQEYYRDLNAYFPAKFQIPEILISHTVGNSLLIPVHTTLTYGEKLRVGGRRVNIPCNLKFPGEFYVTYLRECALLNQHKGLQ